MNLDLEDLYQKYLSCKRVSIDTRTIEEGDLFVALKGLPSMVISSAEKALEKGARFAIVDDPNLAKNPKFIFADDGLKRLQDLSAYHRSLMNIPVLGITGSNGKTTTKELLIAVLSSKFAVSATDGNFNNHIGVPLTILMQIEMLPF